MVGETGLEPATSAPQMLPSTIGLLSDVRVKDSPQPHIPPLLACRFRHYISDTVRFSILFCNVMLLDTGAGGHLLSAPTGSWIVYTLTSHSSCVLIMLSSCAYICTTSLMRTMANRLCTLVILLSTYCENPNWGAL